MASTRGALAALAALAVACGSQRTDAGSAAGGSVTATSGGAGTSGVGSLAADDWPQFRHDATGSSATQEAFSRDDATALHEAWTQEIGEYGYAQPVRAGDSVFVGTGVTGQVYALDAASGAVRWRKDLKATLSSGCGGSDVPGIWGALGVVGGKVFVNAPDGGVYALDPTTGATIWRAAVANPSPHAELIESSVAFSTATGRVYVGVAATAPCDPVQGRVASVDLASGTVVQADIVAPGQVGGGVWSSASVDESAGTVYVGTGNVVGALATEPMAQSIVALDATTLTPIEHWQNPATLADCDFGGSPTLFEDASGRKLVAISSKDGWLYAFDRAHLAAGPVWTRRLAVLDPAKPVQCGDPLAGFGSIVSPAFANGLLYAAGGRTPEGDPGAVVALDPATGDVRFRHVTPGYVLASMAAAGDLLVVASNALDNASSTLEVLDAHTGELLRSFHAASATFAAPAISRGLVLWVTFEGHLTALGR